MLQIERSGEVAVLLGVVTRVSGDEAVVVENELS
jgi:hypothetical protein